MKVFVRHNTSYAVVAEVTPLQDDAIRVESVHPVDGRLPEVGHLIGGVFPSVKDLRQALVTAMKGVVGDTLDHVLLSQDAYHEWGRVAADAVRQAVAEGVCISPENIPDEMAKPVDAGGLLVWVDIPGWRRIEMVIPKSQWAWRKRPN